MNKHYPNDTHNLNKLCDICTDLFEQGEMFVVCTHYNCSNCNQDYDPSFDICDGCHEKIGCCGKCSCIPKDTPLSLIIKALEQSQVKARLYAYGGHGIVRTYSLFYSGICQCFNEKGMLTFTYKDYIKNGYGIPVLTLP